MLDPSLFASSTTCWMTGRSTTVSISFGTDFVAGRNRVPSPQRQDGFADALHVGSDPRGWAVGYGRS
jgi:hypothetical protein